MEMAFDFMIVITSVVGVYYAAFLSKYLRTKDLYRTRLHAEKEGYAEGITFSDLETAISVEAIGRLC